MKKYGGDQLPQDAVAGSHINLRHCGNRQNMNDDEDVESSVNKKPLGLTVLL